MLKARCPTREIKRDLARWPFDWYRVQMISAKATKELQSVIQELHAERSRIDEQILLLEKALGQSAAKARRPAAEKGGKKKVERYWSPAARKAAAERMRKYWADRRKSKS